MGVYHLVICCFLFTIAVCSNTPDVVPDHADGTLPLDTNSENCDCENGDCVTDNLGHTKCICKTGFALQGEFTCKPCDCGSLGKCLFVLTPSSVPDEEHQYQKKCVCDVGKAEKDGVCVDCFCGSNSACDFDQGERRCFCIEGYSEKDGVCTKCDCGFNGECEYENGNKKCTCDEGYLELNGICEECDCGGNGTCSFVDGQQTCKCEPGFSVNKGKCEPCDCGSNSRSCVFVDGVKLCKCNDIYADRSGTCEKCDCGVDARSCNFTDNQKTCSCVEGYVQKGETCELGCSVKEPCQHGGICKEGFCFCLNGTRGEFCEVVSECSNLCPDKKGIQCAYDTASQKAFCKCLDNNLSYDSDRKQCRRTCQEDKSCKNRGKCTGTSQLNKFCDCLEGTTGDFCEEIPACKGVNCGSDALCVFNPSTKKADCACKDSSLFYDTTTRKCKGGCDQDNECLNGGKCGMKGTRKFCNCLPGTRGDRCEIVDDCKSGRVQCRGDSARCGFDVKSRKAVCQCKNSNEVYDYKIGVCRYYCRGANECLNGGKCVINGGFCWCPPRTHGARCEIADDCYYGHVRCRGSNAFCFYDKRILRGNCACKSRNEYYNFWFQRCMRNPIRFG